MDQNISKENYPVVTTIQYVPNSEMTVTRKWALPPMLYVAYQQMVNLEPGLMITGDDLKRFFEAQGGFASGKNAEVFRERGQVKCEFDYSANGFCLEKRAYSDATNRATRLNSRVLYTQKNFKLDTIHNVLKDNRVSVTFEWADRSQGSLYRLVETQDELFDKMTFTLDGNDVSLTDYKSDFEKGADDNNAKFARFRETMTRVLAAPDQIAPEDKEIADVVLPVVETFKLIKERTPQEKAVLA